MIHRRPPGNYREIIRPNCGKKVLRGHVEAFTALGGIPREMLCDNLKRVVLERVGDHIRFHPRILDLAGPYHFAPKPCAVARGNEKGRVERAISVLRHSCFAARTFSSVADLNAQLARWITAVAEALAAEQPRLLPLPAHPFACDLIRPAASGKTPYVRFDANDYSMPHTLLRRPLTLIASGSSTAPRRSRPTRGATIAASGSRIPPT